jgi:hypothetical protein
MISVSDDVMIVHKTAQTLLKSFKRSTHAVVALEFAIVGPIFLVCVLMIIQLGFIFFMQASLDRLAYSTSAYVRSGTAQAAGYSTTTFKSSVVCSLIPAMLNCNNLLYRVWTNASPFQAGGWVYASILTGNATPWCSSNIPSYYYNGGGAACASPTSASQIYCPGPSAAYVMVQMAYPNIFAKFIGTKLAGPPYLISTFISVNDSFGTSFTNPSGC